MQMVILSLFLKPKLLESDEIMNTMFLMLEERRDLPSSLFLDIVLLIGRRIYNLHPLENNQTRGNVLLENGLNPHMYFYFEEADLKKMAEEASGCDYDLRMNID